MPSCYEGKLPDSPSQIPRKAVPEELDPTIDPTRNQTSNNFRSIAQSSRDAIRVSQIRADSVQDNLKRSRTLVENETPSVAKGSAVASSSSRPAKGQETPIPLFPHHKEKTDGESTSGSSKQKLPGQLERRRERRRRAQQIRRLLKSDKQNKEPTPRVFMQWKKSEVQRLLNKQELAIKSAHRAKLQKQEHELESAHRAELQKQKHELESAHQAQLQKQKHELESAHQAQQAAVLKARDSKHIEYIKSMLSNCERIADYLSGHPESADRTVRASLLLLNGLHSSILLALKGLVKGGDMHISTSKELRGE